MYYLKQLSISVFIALIFCFSVSSAYAGCSSTRCVGTIERLYTNTAGDLFIATSGNELALDCTAVDDNYVTLEADNASFNALYAMMLTCLSLNKSIGIRIVTGSDNCAVSYVYMDN